MLHVVGNTLHIYGHLLHEFWHCEARFGVESNIAVAQVKLNKVVNIGTSECSGASVDCSVFCARVVGGGENDTVSIYIILFTSR